MENPVLQKQSLTILQKIEEIKNWHKRQKSNLDANSSTENAENSLKRLLNNGIRCDSGSQLVTSKETQQNFDEIPIKVSNSNFDKVIENNINPHDDHTDVCEKSGVKPKFKFLKKGEGIARFGMGPRKTSKNRSNNVWTLNLVGQTSKFPEREPNGLNSSDQILKNEVSTLKPPDLKLDLNNWKSIYGCESVEELFEKAINSNQLSLFQPDSSVDSSAASFMEKCIAVGRKHLKEAKELRVFETLEQHVLDSSFSSSSSYVSKLMENAVISTPIKNTLERKLAQDQNPKTNCLPTVVLEHDEEVKQSSDQSKPDPAVWIKPSNTKEDLSNSQDISKTDDLEQSLHVKFSDQVDYKSFTDYSQSINNSNPQIVNNNHKELDESEEWKEESGEDSVCCSQCSTAYSSSDEDVKVISPEGKPPTCLQNRLRRLEVLQQNKQIKQKSIEKLDVADLKSKDDLIKVNKLCSNELPVYNFPPILGSKVKELESEIETYREENRKLKTLRENLEKERKNFMLEKKKLISNLEEEKKKISDYLEDEKRKLSKEKLVFQKYSKPLAKNPSKEERKEIQGLKEQLTDLKEELNRKESRWGAAQARVRNQVKVLEDDNKKLREEVEVLRKQAKHLEFLTQKKNKPFNNTKLIHAINELVSNAPVSDDIVVKTFSGGGYFDSNPNAEDELSPRGANLVKVIKESRKESNVKSKSMEDTYNQMVLGNRPKSKSTSSSDQIQLNGLKETSDLPPLGTGGSLQNTGTQNVQKSPIEVVNEDGTVEKLYSDGRKEIKYKNGNIKKIDPIVGNEKMIYFNGDVKENLRDGTVRYFFSEDRMWHTTLPDGLEILDFPNGQVEKRYTNGTVETSYPDNSKKLIYPDGAEEVEYADGTKQKTEADQSKTIWFPNGQREILTAEFKRREYPDGTVKTVYADGVTETNYSSGRVRVKDKFGNLVMDSATLSYS